MSWLIWKSTRSELAISRRFCFYKSNNRIIRRHGEAAAVFACKRYLDEYDEVAVDAAQQTKSNYIPESGLSDEFLDELEKEFKLPCVGLFGECKSREITDEQVRNLFEPIRKARGLDELPACIDFDKEFEGIERGISTQPIKNGNPSEPYRPKVLQQQNSRELPTPTVNRFERTQSPPRKMSAYSAVQADDEHQTVNNFVPSKPHTSSSWTNQKQSRPKPIEPPEPSKTFYPDFKSATHKLNIDNIQKHGTPHVSKPRAPVEEQNYHPTRKLLGGKIRANPTNQPFKDPTAPREPEPMQVDEELEDPLLKGIDPAILEKIKNEVIGSTKEVHWEDIAGLEDAKCTIKEAVVMPLLRPDFFTGLRSAPKGILLFGPPGRLALQLTKKVDLTFCTFTGTGKTLIGKCIASQANATFFSISASSLTSKWIGEGEKLVKALFVYARVRQPSVIFLDEIDSVLTKRSENENEATRRLKTEFLVQLEGAHTTTEQDRVLLVGATNRPQELDDAARRRFTKRLYIPLPDFQVRIAQFTG